MTREIPLSAFDHMFTRNMAGPVQLVFHYPYALDTERVARAYRETARDFVGVAARLVRLDDHTFGYALDPEAAEIRVSEEPPDTPVSNCIDPVELEIGKPLARARITKLGSAGTALGLSMSHGVADGYGFFLFIAAWAARARGQAMPPPNCDRTILSNARAREVGRRQVGDAELAPAGLRILNDVRHPSGLVLEERRLTQALLDGQKAEAKAHGVSPNDLLSAILWQELFREVAVPTTSLLCSVDIRRHQAALGPLYFGNAIMHASVEVKTSTLLATPAHEVAGWIREAVQAVPGKINAAVDGLEAYRAARGLAGLDQVYGFSPESGMLVSNISRVPLEPMDFGAGPPTRVETTRGEPNARGCFVLPDRDGVRLSVVRT